MTTDVEICNRALGAMGAKNRIQSVLNDPSAEGRACATYYAPTLRELLRAAHWDFARDAAYLSLLKALPGTPENQTSGNATWLPSYPQPPWLYSYAYPSVAVAVRYIVPQLYVGDNLQNGIPIFPVQGAPSSVTSWTIRPQRFKVSTDTDPNNNRVKAVLSDQSQAIAIFTRFIDNPDLWDPSFEAALVDLLAYRLVLPLAGDKNLRRDLAASARQTIMEARARDGNEGITYDDNVPDWIRAHGWTNPAAVDFIGQTFWPSFLPAL